MKKPFRQAVGIDMSKDKFDVTLSTMNENFEIKVHYTGQFKNDLTGIEHFYQTITKRKNKDCELWFNMEATGVYYEELAWFLHCNQEKVSVLLPNKARLFAKSLDTRSKTDKIDAKILSRMALERQLTCWNAPSVLLWTLKKISRERQALVQEVVRLSNRRHALDHGHIYHKPTYENIVRRSDSLIHLCSDQIREIENQMIELVKEDPHLYQAIERISKINGLGIKTVITVIAEADGFNNIQNIRQLVSYCGLDVKLNESGYFKGKTTISKHGNSFIRSALYMPALTAARYNKVLKPYYLRLSGRKKVKRMAVVAVMRKLLTLIYVLYRSGAEYDPEYKSSPHTEDETPAMQRPELSVLHNQEQNTSAGVKAEPSNDVCGVDVISSKKTQIKVKQKSSKKEKREPFWHPSSVDESPSDAPTETLCFA